MSTASSRSCALVAAALWRAAGPAGSVFLDVALLVRPLLNGFPGFLAFFSLTGAGAVSTSTSVWYERELWFLLGTVFLVRCLGGEPA